MDSWTGMFFILKKKGCKEMGIWGCSEGLTFAREKKTNWCCSDERHARKDMLKKIKMRGPGCSKEKNKRNIAGCWGTSPLFNKAGWLGINEVFRWSSERRRRREGNVLRNEKKGERVGEEKRKEWKKKRKRLFMRERKRDEEKRKNE